MQREVLWCEQLFERIVEGGNPFRDPEPGGRDYRRREKGEVADVFAEVWGGLFEVGGVMRVRVLGPWFCSPLGEGGSVGIIARYE